MERWNGISTKKCTFIPMPGQHGHAAEAVTLLITASRLCGSKRRICGLSSPKADAIQQPAREAKQNHAQNIRFHCKIR